MRAVSQTVLVTGAFGNVGRHVVTQLVADGCRVVAVDLARPVARKLARKGGDAVTPALGDICDGAFMEKALRGVDAVIHLAAVIPTLSETNPALTQAVNVDATLQLIALMEASPTAKRLVFSSSVAVYGWQQHRRKVFDLDDELAPSDHYGRSKVACERAIQESSLDWSILRIAAAPPNTVAIARNHSETNMFDMSPDARLEITHPGDCGHAFARAVSCEETIGKILFIGGGESCRFEALEFFNGLFAPSGIGPFPKEAFHLTPVPEFYGGWVDTEESQRLLNYQQRDLDDIAEDLRRSFGLAYYLIRPMRPLVTRLMLRTSPWYASQSRR